MVSSSPTQGYSLAAKLGAQVGLLSPWHPPGPGAADKEERKQALSFCL